MVAEAEDVVGLLVVIMTVAGVEEEGDGNVEVEVDGVMVEEQVDGDVEADGNEEVDGNKVVDGNVEADGKEVVAAEVAALLGEASDVEPRLRLKLLIDMVYMH